MIPSVPLSVLIVDDQASVRDMLRDYLTDNGFRTTTASNGRDALTAVRIEKPDLVLLDMRMPEMDGQEFLTILRRDSRLPVIILTAQIEEADRVIGLELGADDYICKPFSLREVKARIQAVFRRTSQSGQPAQTLTAGGIALDRVTHTVQVDSRPVDLTPSEFELLARFMGAPGRVFGRQELLSILSNLDGSERTVDVHIRNLRTKLEPDAAQPRYIETVFGVGYRFRKQD